MNLLPSPKLPRRLRIDERKPDLCLYACQEHFQEEPEWWFCLEDVSYPPGNMVRETDCRECTEGRVRDWSQVEKNELESITYGGPQLVAEDNGGES